MNRATLISVPALLAAHVASAQDFRIGGELGLYHSHDSTVLTEVLDADISLFGPLAIVGGVPFVQLFSDFSGERGARFRIGNPWVAAYYQSKGDVLSFRIGAGAAIPAAQLPDDEAALAVGMYQTALAMDGLLEPWLWTPETLPIMLPSLRLGLDFGILTVDAGADVVILAVLDDNVGDNIEVFIPLYAGAMAHVAFLGFGARLGFAFLPTLGEGFDKVQVSLAPRITANLGPVELEARLTMNLDRPLGFAFDDGRVWGFFLGAHAVF